MTGWLKSTGHLPGFRLTMGFTLFWLGLIVLVPLSTLFLKTASLDWSEFLATVTGPRARAAYRLTFGASLAAALFNTGFGLLMAWVLVRYRFPGRAFVDALVDLPFALPTAVAGIALTTAYSANGPLGRWLEMAGIKVAYTPLGVILALVFVGIPFTVRAIQPVLQDLDPQLEEAAAMLGASRWTTLRRVIWPALIPGCATGFTMAFARALGEYGSVIFISGNMPLKTEIVPLLIMTQLEQFNYAGATALAVVMLTASFGLLLAINRLQKWEIRPAGESAATPPVSGERWVAGGAS